MEIISGAETLDQIVVELGKGWNKVPRQDEIVNSVQVPGTRGKGEIAVYNFSGGLSMLVFDFITKKSLNITISGSHSPPMLFLYVVEGRTRHILEDEQNRYNLDRMEGAISTCRIDKDQQILFPADESIKIIAIAIHRIPYLCKVDSLLEATPQRLKSVLMDVQGEQAFLYQFTSTMSIFRALEQVLSCPFKALVRSTYMEAKVLEILALQFRHYIKDTAPNGQFVSIREDDLSKIMNARDILESNLNSPPTIPELAKMVGVNINKLKRAFKQVFDTTINKYVTQQRLELARDLLLDGNKTVAEVCAEIGYDNGSYFARIFKKRFGKHPSDVLTNLTLDVEEKMNSLVIND